MYGTVKQMGESNPCLHFSLCFAPANSNTCIEASSPAQHVFYSASFRNHTLAKSQFVVFWLQQVMRLVLLSHHGTRRHLASGTIRL